VHAHGFLQLPSSWHRWRPANPSFIFTASNNVTTSGRVPLASDAWIAHGLPRQSFLKTRDHAAGKMDSRPELGQVLSGLWTSLSGQIWQALSAQLHHEKRASMFCF
jgi:hypothetical protein